MDWAAEIHPLRTVVGCIFTDIRRSEGIHVISILNIIPVPQKLKENLRRLEDRRVPKYIFEYRPRGSGRVISCKLNNNDNIGSE